MKTMELPTGSRRSWSNRIRAHWPEIRVARMQAIPGPGSGGTATLRMHLHLGVLTPADVRVELAAGRRRDALPYGYVAVTARRRSVARTDGGRS